MGVIYTVQTLIGIGKTAKNSKEYCEKRTPELLAQGYDEDQITKIIENKK
jgi:uncharacterized membrane-anchored protein